MIERVTALAKVNGQEMADLLKRCNRKKPDATDIAELRKYLAEVPGLWDICGNLGRHMEGEVIESMHATPAIAESVKAGQLARRRELGYETAPPLERALIEHMGLCWLRLQMAEHNYSGVMGREHTLTLGEYWEHRLSAAQRRYLRAVETLARIRRMGLPAVQVNIAAQGGRQVNVAGEVTAAGRSPGPQSPAEGDPAI